MLLASKIANATPPENFNVYFNKKDMFRIGEKFFERAKEKKDEACKVSSFHNGGGFLLFIRPCLSSFYSNKGMATHIFLTSTTSNVLWNCQKQTFAFICNGSCCFIKD